MASPKVPFWWLSHCVDTRQDSLHRCALQPPQPLCLPNVEVTGQPDHSLHVCRQPPQPSDGHCQGHRADGAPFKNRTAPSENWSDGVGKFYMVLLFLEFQM